MALHIRSESGGADQGLGWDTPRIETVSTHLSPLDQGDPGADRRRDVRGDQTCGTCPDDDQVAIEPAGPGPLLQRPPPLESADEPAGQEGEHPQKGEGTQQPGRENSGQGVELRELRPGVHINHRPGQHPDLADQIESDGLHWRQRHHQVDDKEGEDGDEAKHEEVERTVPFDPLVHRLQVTPEALLDRIPKEEAPHEEGQRRAERRGERNDHGSLHEPEDRPPGESHDRRTGEGEGRHRHVGGEVDPDREAGVRTSEILDGPLPSLQVLQGQELPEIEDEEGSNDRQDERGKRKASCRHVGPTAQAPPAFADGRSPSGLRPSASRYDSSPGLFRLQ